MRGSRLCDSVDNAKAMSRGSSRLYGIPFNVVHGNSTATRLGVAEGTYHRIIKKDTFSPWTGSAGESSHHAFTGGIQKIGEPGASSIMAVPPLDSAGAALYGRRWEHEGVRTIANHSAQEFGAQLPCRPQYPRIRTDGKRTAHGVRVVYRTERAASGGALTARELGFGTISSLHLCRVTLPRGDARQWPFARWCILPDMERGPRGFDLVIGDLPFRVFPAWY